MESIVQNLIYTKFTVLIFKIVLCHLKGDLKSICSVWCCVRMPTFRRSVPSASSEWFSKYEYTREYSEKGDSRCWVFLRLQTGRDPTTKRWLRFLPEISSNVRTNAIFVLSDTKVLNLTFVDIFIMRHPPPPKFHVQSCSCFITPNIEYVLHVVAMLVSVFHRHDFRRLQRIYRSISSQVSVSFIEWRCSHPKCSQGRHIGSRCL